MFIILDLFTEDRQVWEKVEKALLDTCACTKSMWGVKGNEYIPYILPKAMYACYAVNVDGSYIKNKIKETVEKVLPSETGYRFLMCKTDVWYYSDKPSVDPKPVLSNSTSQDISLEREG